MGLPWVCQIMHDGTPRTSHRAASLQVLLGSAQPYQLSNEINIKRFSICLSSSLHFVPGPGLISCSEGGQQYAE